MPTLYNDALDDVPLWERIEEFMGGMDGFHRPTLLPPNVSQSLINVLVEDLGDAGTRPGMDSVGGGAISAGKAIKCLAYYDTPATELLLASIDGHLYSWDGGALSTWQDRAGYPFGASPVAAMVQLLNLMYVTSGVGPWSSFNGTVFLGLGSAVGVSGDPPNGATLLCVHTFRVFASGDAANPDTIWASNIGDAGAGQWNHANFSFRVGRGEGQPIVAMVSGDNYNLFVFKTDSIYLVAADPMATTAADWVIQKIAAGVTAAGPRAALAVGGDVFFMDRTGVRSIARSAGTEAAYDATPPISQPMQPYIDRINWAAASTICAGKYRQFVLWAIPLDTATTPNCVLVWNERTNAWMGAWTGWTPTQFVTTEFLSVQDLFFGDSASKVCRWLDKEDREADTTYLDDGLAIATTARTRSMLFGEPVNWKDLFLYELRFQPGAAVVNVTPYLDGQAERSFTTALLEEQNTLPVDLPFNLAMMTPKVLTKNLNGFRPCNEFFLEISSTASWWRLKNVTAGAYLGLVNAE